MLLISYADKALKPAEPKEDASGSGIGLGVGFGLSEYNACTLVFLISFTDKALKPAEPKEPATASVTVVQDSTGAIHVKEEPGVNGSTIEAQVGSHTVKIFKGIPDNFPCLIMLTPLQ